MEEKETFEDNLKKLDIILNEPYEFEYFVEEGDIDENVENDDDQKYKNIPFEELEKKAFYEFED